MKFVFASDSFKGSLTSEMTAILLEKAAKSVFPGAECISIPVADGGEGSTDVISSVRIGKTVKKTVHGPFMKPFDSSYYVFDDTAFIESAKVCGLADIPSDLRDPLNATSYGLGELILSSLDEGYRKIYISLGGVCTNDGGTGCLEALGMRFLSEDETEIQGSGKNLGLICDICDNNFDKRIKECEITVLTDVQNPLCGEKGATMIFSKQKGASDEDMQFLEKGMKNFRDRIRKMTSLDPDDIKGAGAAGGLGAALSIFFNGKIKSGIDVMLDLLGFDETVKDADLVITGEGKIDHQSVLGKAVKGVGEHSKKAGVPVIALCGSVGEGAEVMYDHGISSIMSIMNSPMSLDYALKNAEELYFDAALRMFRMIKCGYTFDR